MRTMKYDFSITRTNSPKNKPDPHQLAFGTVFTDHMFLMDYKEGQGWHNGRIVPYGPLSLDPATVFFHYAQGMFEGLKAYRTKAGKIVFFRPDMNAKRTRKTNERMCMPDIEEELYLAAIRALVDADRDWVPAEEGTSLYIRPFIFASERFLGVRASREYIFAIILSPVGPYYKGGMQPTRIYVEEEYARSVRGGTGFAKICGNYAPGLLSEQKAHEMGYDQVLWLDGAERKYVEEIGTSNAFFKVDGQLWTAPLESGTILPGITRDSVITLLKEWGYPVLEKRFTIQEIYELYEAGKVEEVFATGTAAVISPVGELRWGEKQMFFS
ncbi:MAG: branched-chain amino acid aminotransferase, partial [Bacillota bacterium]|nr:branched-chain amino acid aminotransferase [Bacillota bacterium]